MPELALVGDVETPAERRLGELAEVIRREHAALVDAAGRMVLHAIAIGEALIEAKRLVPLGQWTVWVETNLPHGRRRAMCGNYMRLAALKEHVDPELSITSNLLMVRGLPKRSSATPRYPLEMRDQARQLLEAGLTQQAAADQLGVTTETVRAWATERGWSGRNQSSRRQRAARRDRDLDAEALERAQNRHLRYGEPGRAAVGKAVRRLAQVQGRDATREALLDLAAIAEAWAESLASSKQVTA